jgi:hypothetical protein
VGSLPLEIQSYVTFTAAVGRSVHNADAAKALPTFFATPAARRALIDAGMEVEW